MEYRQLGQSGLKVSLHTLGTMNFAGEGFFGMAGSLNPTESKRLVDVAVDAGVNIFDTSNAYTTGKSEEALGAVLKGRSDQLLVGTKVRFGMGPGPNEQGLSRFHIIHECEASLKRLGRDRIDVYFLHEWDGLTPVDEMLAALDTLALYRLLKFLRLAYHEGADVFRTQPLSKICLSANSLHH
jgi:aryl-alcohol dehydrogenase-like predicted oxidoreductase